MFKKYINLIKLDKMYLAFSIIQNYYTKSNNFQKKDANQNFFICQTAVKQPHPKSLSPAKAGRGSQRGTFSPSLLGEGARGMRLQQKKFKTH